jgi:hypothetical protein
MRRCGSTLSLGLLLLLWAAPGLGADVSLRPFDANYKLYESGMHVADTRISLQREGDLWYWRMAVEARGIFALFTKKKPYAETVFSNDGARFRIHHILVSDGVSERKKETARFDWENGKIDVLRKGKSKQLELPAEIYDYQSVHLLAAAMNRQKIEKRTVDFYRKGRLLKSQIVAEGNATVDIDGSSVAAVVFEQSLSKSDSTTRYYYDAENPILPLRVEKREAGERSTVLTLQHVKWIP